MTRHLLIRIRLHDSRYHGMGEWRPSPARLFQALVAAAARGALIDEESGTALEWLETLTPPIMGLPTMRASRRFAQFGPDNDIDSVGREPRRVDEIRSSKTIEPKLLNRDVPFLYAWTFEENDINGVNSQAICSLANRVYQFGRGVDMGWAACELLDADEFEARLSDYVGVVYRPSDKGAGRKLACPKPGSLKSLKERYAAGSRRFTTLGVGKAAKQLFSQPPKPRFVQVSYGSPTSRRLYELRGVTPEASFRPWPLSEVSRLINLLRDLAVDRLRDAFPDRTPEIERIVVGRKADGADAGPSAMRIRIIPLPSIGHHHADRQIRRVVVEVPPECPFREDDIHWAFSGLEIVERDTGEILDILTPSTDESMLRHYGLGTRARDRVWRSVTPVALPESAKRRRIEPTRMAAEAKDGTERADEQGRAAAAVVQALRHSEVRTRAEMIRIQREPFEAKGERVEKFAPGTRFVKERLWHVEVTFSESVAGPLVIGDGRFLGLGVMAPVQTDRGVQAFVIEDGLLTTAEGTEVTRALRRAVMARVQAIVGLRTSLPTFFTGHERDGSPAKTERYPHLTFVYDPGAERLLIIAPHVVERRAARRDEIRHLRILETALTQFRELRAGASGHLTLRASSIDAYSDPLFRASQTWKSVTPYQVTRHKKQVGAGESLSEDLRAECRRRGLPEPQVISRELRGVPGVGLVGGAQLRFEVAVRGPIILGRSRHLGGGLFEGIKP
jgi:CRISPR-associated protein Csb2